MSDPMRPASRELSSRQRSLQVAPDASFVVTPEHKEFMSKYKKLPEVVELLASKRTVALHSVLHNKKVHSDEVIRTSTAERLATTKAGPGIARLRSASAKEVANSAFMYLPEEHEYASRSIVKAKMETTVRFDGMGTIMTLNRLKRYLPNREGTKGTQVFTAEEARYAVEHTGFIVEGPVEPKIINGSEPGTGVKVSKHSYNGLPTEGNSDNVQAMRDCVQLARTALRRIREEYDDNGDEGVDLWYDGQRKKRPWLMTLMGRAKDDTYDTGKINDNCARFYITVPRPMMLIMQTVTQAYSEHKHSIMDHTREFPQHGFAGCSLAHGGAEKLVAILEQQLEDMGYAYVVMGDDSQVFIEVEINGEKHILRMSLDCSSFDLTQKWEVSLPFHTEMAGKLKVVEGAVARVWYNFMKRRDIVVDKTVRVEMRDGGPSGMTYQAETNSAIAAALIERFIVEIAEALIFLKYGGLTPDAPGTYEERRDLEGYLNFAPEDAEEQLAGVFAEVARDFGFTAKVTDAYCSNATTIKEQARERPFQFVGYHFSVDDKNRVTPFCDLPRSMSQLVYPSGPKLSDNVLFTSLEAMRLGGVIASMGVPPLELIKPFEAMRMKVVSLLQNAYHTMADRAEGEDFEPAKDYSNFLSDNPLGPMLPRSIKGMLDLVLFDTEKVWLEDRSVSLLGEEVLATVSDTTEHIVQESPAGGGNPFEDMALVAAAMASQSGDMLAEEFFNYDTVKEALKVVASDAHTERPPSKRNQGRPPPITTTAEYEEKREKKFRAHEAAKEKLLVERMEARDKSGYDDEEYQAILAKVSKKDQAVLSEVVYEDSGDEGSAHSVNTIGSIEAADIAMSGIPDPRRKYVGSWKPRKR